MAWLLRARARQIDQVREVIDATRQNLKESKGANKGYFDPADNLRAEYLQISDLAPVHETMKGQSHSGKLDVRWWGPYWVTDIAQTLGT